MYKNSIVTGFFLLAIAINIVLEGVIEIPSSEK